MRRHNIFGAALSVAIAIIGFQCCADGYRPAVLTDSSGAKIGNVVDVFVARNTGETFALTSVDGLQLPVVVKSGQLIQKDSSWLYLGSKQQFFDTPKQLVGEFPASDSVANGISPVTGKTVLLAQPIGPSTSNPYANPSYTPYSRVGQDIKSVWGGVH